MPTPTATEVERVREMAGLPSLVETQGLVDGLTTEQWDRMLELIPQWEQVRFTDTVVRRGGVEIRPKEVRLTIRREVRLRLGLTEDIPFDELFGSHSGPTKTEVRW